jgi:hypothetical protein
MGLAAYNGLLTGDCFLEIETILDTGYLMLDKKPYLLSLLTSLMNLTKI